MLAHAGKAVRAADVGNAMWLLASDVSLPALGSLLGQPRVRAVTIGQALHWMAPQAVFETALLLRPQGGIAVLTNGTPLWQHDTD